MFHCNICNCEQIFLWNACSRYVFWYCSYHCRSCRRLYKCELWARPGETSLRSHSELWSGLHLPQCNISVWISGRLCRVLQQGKTLKLWNQITHTILFNIYLSFLWYIDMWQERAFLLLQNFPQIWQEWLEGKCFESKWLFAAWKSLLILEQSEHWNPPLSSRDKYTEASSSKFASEKIPGEKSC